MKLAETLFSAENRIFNIIFFKAYLSSVESYCNVDITYLAFKLDNMSIWIFEDDFNWVTTNYKFLPEVKKLGV